MEGNGATGAAAVGASSVAAAAPAQLLSLRVMRLCKPTLAPVQSATASAFEQPFYAFTAHDSSDLDSSSISQPSAVAATIRKQRKQLARLDIAAGPLRTLAARDLTAAVYTPPSSSSNERNNNNVSLLDEPVPVLTPIDKDSNQEDESEAQEDENEQEEEPSVLRDFGLSQFLVLPQAFGSMHLGETFSSYICVNNESSVTVREAGVKIELQTATQRFLLYDSTTSLLLKAPEQNQPLSPMSPNNASSVANAAASKNSASPVSSLRPSETLDVVVHHEIKELGVHILVCQVQYIIPAGVLPGNEGVPGTAATASASLHHGGEEKRMTFRKIFKFPVVNPLSVKTKVCSGSAGVVYLEAQVQNATSLPMYLERMRFEPVPAFTQLDMNTISVPNPNYNRANVIKNRVSKALAAASTATPAETPTEQQSAESSSLDSNTLTLSTFGDAGLLAPGDVRQYLYVLTPRLQQQQQQQQLQQPLQPQQIQPQNQLLKNPSNSSLLSSTNGTELSSTPTMPSITISSAWNESVTQALRSAQLGKLDIIWKSAMGETGRLQTSQLSRKLPPPVASSPGILPHLTLVQQQQQQQQQQASTSSSNQAQTGTAPSGAGISSSTGTASIPVAINDGTEPDLIILEAPGEVYLETPFTVRCRLSTRAGSNLVSRFAVSSVKSRMGSVLLCGPAVRVLMIGMEGFAVFELQFFPLAQGLQRVTGIRVSEVTPSGGPGRSWDVDCLVEVFIRRNVYHYQEIIGK